MMTRLTAFAAALLSSVLLCACSSAPDPKVQGERAQRSLQVEFDRLDADASGDVSAIELSEARNAQFDALDTDDSGFLNRAELQAMRRSRPRVERDSEQESDPRPPRSEGRGGRGGAQSGGGDRGAQGGGRRGSRSSDPRATMDSNGDGVISRDEFIGRGQRFLAETDFDGDGSVTAEELEKGLIRARSEVRRRR